MYRIALKSWLRACTLRSDAFISSDWYCVYFSETRYCNGMNATIDPNPTSADQPIKEYKTLRTRAVTVCPRKKSKCNQKFDAWAVSTAIRLIMTPRQPSFCKLAQRKHFNIDFCRKEGLELYRYLSSDINVLPERHGFGEARTEKRSR